MKSAEERLTVKMHDMITRVAHGECTNDFATVFDRHNRYGLDAFSVFNAVLVHVRSHCVYRDGLENPSDAVIKDAVEKWIEENIDLIGEYIFCERAP